MQIYSRDPGVPGASNSGAVSAFTTARAAVDEYLDYQGDFDPCALETVVRGAVEQAAWSAFASVGDVILVTASAFAARGVALSDDLREDLPYFAEVAVRERPESLLLPIPEGEPEGTDMSAYLYPPTVAACRAETLMAADEPPTTPEDLAAELLRHAPRLRREEAAFVAVRAFHQAGHIVGEGALAEASAALDALARADMEAERAAAEVERAASALAQEIMTGENPPSDSTALTCKLMRRVEGLDLQTALWVAGRCFAIPSSRILSAPMIQAAVPPSGEAGWTPRSINEPSMWSAGVVPWAAPEEELVDDESDIAAGESLADLTHPPGFVGALIDWIVASAERPSRELALGVALGFTGALAGRRYASPTDLRTNLYAVTLAPSGHGKNHALTQVKRLIVEAGLERFLGPARVMSASALRKVVRAKPSALLLIDEFGGFVKQILDRKAGLHNALIKNDLLEYFSAANTVFMGAEYAGESAEPIYSPNVLIHGTSTQDDFWSGLNSLAGDDGLLARFILLNVTGDRPSVVEPSLAPRFVSPELIATARRIVEAVPIGNLDSNPTPRDVPYGHGAKAVLDHLAEKVEAHRERADSAGRASLNRVVEHAIKLALTVAVGECPEAPRISAATMEWASRLAWLSACTMMAEMRDRVADNDRQANFNKVLRIIKEAGPEGITEGKVVDRTRNLDGRTRSEILRDLQTAGRVVLRVVPRADGKGRGRERYLATARALSS